MVHNASLLSAPLSPTNYGFNMAGKEYCSDPNSYIQVLQLTVQNLMFQVSHPFTLFLKLYLQFVMNVLLEYSTRIHLTALLEYFDLH